MTLHASITHLPHAAPAVAPPVAETRIRVWDLPVRLLHAALALLLLAEAAALPGAPAPAWLHAALLLAVALRVVWGLVGSRHARFADFPPDPSGAVLQLAEIASGRRYPREGHSPLGALLVYLLLLALAGVAVTGLLAALAGAGWALPAHRALVAGALGLALLHFVAVLTGSRRLGVNLPLSIVTGYKTFRPPEDFGE